jgi:hypothetical protein
LHRYADAEHSDQKAFSIADDLDTPAERCAVLHRQGRLCFMQQQYRNVLEYWVRALAIDQRLGHPAREDLQERVEKLVKEQHFDEVYVELCKTYGMA